MPYTPKNWVNGTDAANATNLNHLETQYTEASLSYGPDFFGAGFVLTGFVCTKDGSVANQLDVTAGAAYLLQAATDSTFRGRRPPASTPGQFTTATPSTTYFLDLNPDGTFSWGTSHSAVVGHLTICSVTTDGSGNILAVTDTRVTAVSLLPAMLGALSLPALGGIGGQASAGSFGVPVIVAQALRVHVTSTAVQTILSYTPAVNGLYRIITYAVAQNSAPSLSLTGQWTDPDRGVVGPVPAIVVGPSPVVTANGYAPGSATALSVTPIIGWAAITGPIKVFYQNFGASPNDFVSAVIERLA